MVVLGVIFLCDIGSSSNSLVSITDNNQSTFAGTYTSNIKDAGASASWSTLGWVPNWLSKDCDLCESYNYSAWSVCDGNGVQHRTLDTDPAVPPTFPTDCYGGAQPVYMRVCPPCDSWIYSAWSTCSGGQQTRTVDHTTYPPNCWGGSPELTRSCS